MNTKSIFYIESFVFISYDDKYILLYNSITHEFLNFATSKQLLYLIQEIEKPSNMRCLRLTEERLEDQEIKKFTTKVRDSFWGDLISDEFIKEKPVIIPPICNFQRDNELDAHNGFLYLNEARIITDISPTLNTKIYEKIFRQTQLLVSNDSQSELSQEVFCKILSKLSKEHLTFLGTNVMQYLSSHKILEIVPNPLLVTICTDYLKFKWKSLFEPFHFKIVITFPLQKEVLANIVDISKQSDSGFTYIFLVSNEEEYNQTEEIINILGISDYNIIPIYNDNIPFFEKFIFTTSDSLSESQISKEDIFQHQIFNSYDFGKITIFPNGDIQGNPYFPIWGNIMHMDIREMVSDEIRNGHSWLRVRNQTPCDKCRFRWLCPSPSSYELEIGRSNLCQIKA